MKQKVGKPYPSFFSPKTGVLNAFSREINLTPLLAQLDVAFAYPDVTLATLDVALAQLDVELPHVLDLAVHLILFRWVKGIILSHFYCQALVQVPNPLSQQAPNPDPKVRPSLDTQKPNSLDWADTIITWATTTPPPHPQLLSMKE